MAKKIINKRVIAILLTLVMLFNGLQIIGTAVENDEFSLVQNFADTYYKQDGSTGSASDWEIHLSKTAAPAGKDNLFNITLKVETKDTVTQLAGSTDGAVVLVLDVSNSMDKAETGCTHENCTAKKNAAIHCTRYERENSWRDSCENCGQTKAQHSEHHKYVEKTQLDSLKAAVADFLDAFAKDAAAGEKRLVSVVVFGTKAKTIQTWVDVSNANDRAALISKINTLSTGDGAYLGNNYLFNGGTNMEGGLVLARNLLKQNAVAEIPVANQSLILFSDGAPTACVSNAESTAVDEIGYAGNDTGTQTDRADYNDIASILSGVSAAKIAVAYNYNDELDILKVPPFTRVLNSGADSLSVDLQGEAGKVITNKTNASTVTDPMGTGVSMVTVTTNYNQVNQQWDLSKYTPVVANDITTYTITYQVELDPMAVELDPEYPGYTVLTPANGATTLNYTYGENATPVKADFNEPNIRGVRSFTVRYEYEGNIPEGAPAVPATQTYKAGVSVQVAPVPTLKNYTFSGWSKSDFVMPAEDVVIIGSWTENAKYNYSLTYDANFGTGETKADAENVTNTYAVSHNITVDTNTFVRENYTFAGWNTEADGSGKTYAADNIVALTAENNTEILYAQWIENTKYAYTVIYDANFGAGETKADAENVIGTYATEYTIGVDANTFVRENHTFIGWSTEPNGEVIYHAGDEIHFVEGGEEVLYAQWVEHTKYSYTVIYNGNGGTLVNGGLSYGDSQNVQQTYSTTHNVDVDTNSFIRENYTFIGWNTEADGTGKAYAANDVIALTAENNTETLYAQWSENPKYDYSVIYNANFGENETKADAENVTGIYQTAYNIGVNENTFVRENYTFIGWNTEADGTGKAYAANDVIALTAENNTEILYAQWEINTYDYIVNYWVRVNEEAYVIFAGELGGAPVGEKVAVGSVIDQAYLTEKGLPETLTDAEHTYELAVFQGVVVADAENIVNVYYTCVVEEEVETPEPPVVPPVDPEEPEEPEDVEIPDEDVPLGGQPGDTLPKTGDPIYIYIGSAAVSAAGLVGLFLAKNRKEEEEEE